MPDQENPLAELRVVSYNTRHANGMDGRVDLERLSRRLAGTGADLIGLQEVDRMTRRSGGVDQIAELGRMLGFNWAYGAFMEYDGGQYGLGVLSRYPVASSRTVPIPDRKEPRVALFAEIVLPNEEVVCLADIHFDCIADDAERYGQAQTVASEIKRLDAPCALMGDFNDEPGTRTVELFRAFMLEAVKPESDRLTYPSDGPAREIDFLFLSPPGRWHVRRVELLHDPMTSDHRPFVADVSLLPKRR